MTSHHLVAAAAVAFIVAMFIDCFNPGSPRPGLACGSGGSCPDGQTCVDGYCRIGDSLGTCGSNADCLTADHCLTGSCNPTSHQCEHTTTDCSALNDTCNVGMCAPGTGACYKQPRNDAGKCGQDVTGCGGCSGASQSGCGHDGYEECTCTDKVCRSGACVADTTTQRSCSVQTGCSQLADGDVCFCPDPAGPATCCDNGGCTFRGCYNPCP